MSSLRSDGLVGRRWMPATEVSSPWIFDGAGAYFPLHRSRHIHWIHALSDSRGERVHGGGRPAEHERACPAGGGGRPPRGARLAATVPSSMAAAAVPLRLGFLVVWGIHRRRKEPRSRILLGSTSERSDRDPKEHTRKSARPIKQHRRRRLDAPSH